MTGLLLIAATSCANQKPTPKLYLGKPLKHYAIHAGNKICSRNSLGDIHRLQNHHRNFKKPKNSCGDFFKKHTSNHFTTFLTVATAFLQYHTSQLTDKYVLKSNTPHTTKQNIISFVSIAAGNSLTGIGGNLFSEACVQYFNPTPNPKIPHLPSFDPTSLILLRQGYVGQELRRARKQPLALSQTKGQDETGRACSATINITTDNSTNA